MAWAEAQAHMLAAASWLSAGVMAIMVLLDVGPVEWTHVFIAIILALMFELIGLLIRNW
jgi:hypothetical protein